MESVALVDGDVVCHIACGEAWKLRLEMLEADGHDLDALKGAKEIPEYNPMEDIGLLQRCWADFQKEMSIITDHLFCENVIMAVKDKHNYRDDIYPEYKAKRNVYRVPNPFVDIVRRKAVYEGIAVYSEGREADDYLRIWASQCQQHNIDYTIVSIDKDLLCIPGMHWNIKKKEFTKVSEHEGMLHYYSQILQGDSTDNIPGLPGIGPKKADAALVDCMTEEECQEVVASMYIAAYEDDWESHLLSNGKMIHIQRAFDDHFTIGHWPIVQELR